MMILDSGLLFLGPPCIYAHFSPAVLLQWFYWNNYTTNVYFPCVGLRLWQPTIYCVGGYHSLAIEKNDPYSLGHVLQV